MPPFGSPLVTGLAIQTMLSIKAMVSTKVITTLLISSSRIDQPTWQGLNFSLNSIYTAAQIKRIRTNTDSGTQGGNRASGGAARLTLHSHDQYAEPPRLWVSGGGDEVKYFLSLKQATNPPCLFYGIFASLLIS
jgi:hypothetical protein